MNSNRDLNLRRFVVPIGAALFAVVLAFVFWRPLYRWFTGESVGAPTGKGVSEQAGGFAVTARLDPPTPAQKGNTVWLDVRDANGKPVERATVDIQYVMPAMGGMPEMRGKADVADKGGGRYAARFDLPMSGSWTLEAQLDQGGRKARLDYGITVGTPGLIQKSAEGGNTAASYYTCSMHPSVRQQTPGKCPICGMDLTPVTKGVTEPGAVVLDEGQRKEIGLRSEPAVRAPLRLELHALGKVTVDETKLADITVRVKGWIQSLDVDATGQPVKKGARLFTLYSPELYAAQQEYLLALQSRSAEGGLAQASKAKLRLLGLPEAQIERIASAGHATEDVPFFAPASGYVLEKNVVAGAAVEPGQRLYRIAPLDPLWIEADVFEGDLPSVSLGQEAKVTLPYLPGKVFTGKVTYVYPVLEGATRTGKIRIELANPERVLKPEMFADVTLVRDAGPRLQVPASAVVYTGPRRIVFVDRGGGQLVPKDVELGARAGDRYEILSGLEEGEQVVTSGNFLVSAESRIKSATDFWSGGAR